MTLELAIRIHHTKGYFGASEADWRVSLFICYCYRRVEKGKVKGKEREKNGEAKPKPFFCLIGVVSGRPLEVPTQLLGFLVKALPAISAKARLWGTKCGSWPSLATLTCTV